MTTDPLRVRWPWFDSLLAKLRLLNGRPRLFDRIELVFAGLLAGSIIAVFVAHLLPACKGSLWGDEIYTVAHFSSQGPLRVMTHYCKPNNHVFFNLLNSLQPFGKPYDPMVARFFSFAIMGFGMLCLFYKKWSRLEIKEAALVCWILFANGNVLDLGFQARGYGWIFVSALIISLQILRYFETGDRASLVWIGAFTVIGTYTIPTFILFGGAALLLMFFFTPKKEIFWTGLAALFLILLLYLPLAEQIFKSFTKYEEGGRKEFADFAQLGDVIRTYFLSAATPILFLVCMWLWLAPWVTRRPIREKRAVQISALTMLIAAAITLLMETPKGRTLLYISIPCSLAALLYWRSFLEKLSLRVLQTGLFCAVASFAIGKNIVHSSTFEYVPLDDWVGLGDLAAHLRPGKNPVFMQKDPYLLAPYLPPNVVLTENFDEAAFSRGELFCVASAVSTLQPINREADLTAQYPSAFVQFSSSKRGRSFPLWSIIPETRIIPEVSSHGTEIHDSRIFDRDSNTGVQLMPAAEGRWKELRLAKLNNSHSLFVIFSQEIPQGAVRGVFWNEGGQYLSKATIRNSGRVLCIPLGDPSIHGVTLSFSKKVKQPQLNEVWSVPKAQESGK